jgi:hypothetical protein
MAQLLTGCALATANTLFRPTRASVLPVLLCPFSPLSENILIAIDGASGRRPAKHPIPGPMAVRLGLFAREPIGGAGLPHRSYVGVASGLLKDSNSALPIGHGGTRLGGSTCRPHEVGQGPQWELGNVEIADVSLTKFCVSRKCSRGKVPALWAQGRPNTGVERDLETRDDPLFILDLIRGGNRRPRLLQRFVFNPLGHVLRGQEQPSYSSWPTSCKASSSIAATLSNSPSNPAPAKIVTPNGNLVFLPSNTSSIS